MKLGKFISNRPQFNQEFGSAHGGRKNVRNVGRGCMILWLVRQLLLLFIHISEIGLKTDNENRAPT